MWNHDPARDALGTVFPPLHVTAELSIRLLRAARGEQLQCEARVVKPGRQISFTEADVYCESAGKPRVHVARASATMALTRQAMAS